MTKSDFRTTAAPGAGAYIRNSLHFDPALGRNRFNVFFNGLAGIFAAIAVLPLILVLAYVLLKGGGLIRPSLFSELPPAPGSMGGGMGNAILGTLLVTVLASLIALAVLAHFSEK